MELKKDQVIRLYDKYKSKRKVALELGVSRQYIIQVIKNASKRKAESQKRSNASH